MNVSSSDGLLAGKVVVVSGAGPGLGRSVALACASQGADVVLVARRTSRLERIAQEITAFGRRAECIVADVTDGAACAAAAAQIDELFGRLDVVVNNAFHPGDYARFDDADFDAWRDTFDVNLWGTLAFTRAMLPLLEQSDDSRIIMINTMSVQKIEEASGAYAASKAALASVTKTLARELGPKGVRVNSVHPGYIWGDAVEWYLNHLAQERGVTFDEVHAEVAGQTALGYLPPADEIAGAVVFLASPLARAVTGQSINVNAGHWIP